MEEHPGWAAFAGLERFATGAPESVARAVSRRPAERTAGPVLVFDRATGRVVDLDLRGDEQQVAARYAAAPEPQPARGRPKLGVVAREVTLLPRHWDWLGAQPGGASAALRRLVDSASKASATADRARRAIETGYRFMSALAGDLPRFEAASRALFAHDPAGFADATADWPADVRDELGRYLAGAFELVGGAGGQQATGPEQAQTSTGSA